MPGLPVEGSEGGAILNLQEQLAASVAAEAECSLVHDRFAVTICGKRADVVRAFAALEAATRHDPRPVPLVRLGQGDFTRDLNAVGTKIERVG